MIKTITLKALALQAALLCAVFLIAAPIVHADPPNTALTTVKYCKQKIPQKAEGGCTEANMNKLRSVVADGCNSKDNACIEQAAEKLVDKIAAKNPKNTKDFNDALDAVTTAAQPGVGAGTPIDHGPGAQGEHCSDNSNNCDLVKLYVNPFIRILTLLVGLVVAASLIMGAVQYSASNGDAQRIAAAKSRISNTLLAFFAYAFLYAFLNFLIPGGIF
jgi:hypothetical protein